MAVFISCEKNAVFVFLLLTSPDFYFTVREISQGRNQRIMTSGKRRVFDMLNNRFGLLLLALLLVGLYPPPGVFRT